MPVRANRLVVKNIQDFVSRYGVKEDDLNTKIESFVKAVSDLHEQEIGFDSVWIKIHDAGVGIFGAKHIGKLSDHDRHEIFIHIDKKWYAIGIRISVEDDLIRIFENPRPKVFGL